MIEDPQKLEEALFELAEQKSSAAERAAFLDGVCRDNPALRARLDTLLESHFGAVEFLTKSPKRPASSEPLAVPSVVPPELPAVKTPAQMIGRYKLLEKIGEGGFGEVWMAEQREPVKRRVALKIIKLGMDTRQIVARFEAERQALALMDHPNIAKVLDAGATDAGRPYFVMELVRGCKITDYCDENALPTHERLKLFILICQAIQHAHQKGIIHRDIKPSNVLVTLHDGVPVPKVIDFGIAKATQGELTDKTLFTQFQQFIGTPAYISPEQAETSGLDIDTRSDIYSLGVLLYELLVGQTPFDAKEMMKGGIDSLRRIIREKEPTKPSTRFKTLPAVELTTTARRRQTDAMKLTHLMRGDLDWIVMKCLEKDRARRYETANGLATDIRRYLSDEPVVARSPSAVYRFQKTVRRNKLAFTATAIVLLVLVFGAVAVIFVQHRANEDYRERLYVSELNRAGLAWQAGQSAQMLALLERCPPALRRWEWEFLRKQADRWDQTVVLAATNLAQASLAADGRLMAVAAGGVIQIREFPTGHWLLDIPFRVGWNSLIAVSPRKEYLATLDRGIGVIQIWNMRTGKLAASVTHGSTEALGWSSDGQRLATVGKDQIVRVWDVKTARELHTFSTDSPVRALAFSPDDNTLAVGTTKNKAELLDAGTGVVKRTFQTYGETVYLLEFSPDGRNLVIGSHLHDSDQGDCRAWSLGQEGSLDLGKSPIAVSFSPDGGRLLVNDAAGTIRLWDLNQRVEVERFSVQAESAQLLPDGRIFVSRQDGIRIYQIREAGFMQLRGYPSALRTLAFSPDSRWLVAAGLDRQVFIWDAPSGQLAGIYTNHVSSAFAVAFSPDGHVATASSDRKVQVWDPASQRLIWETSLAPASDAYWLAFSPDGRKLYAASQIESTTTLDAATGNRLNTIKGLVNVVDGLAVSPDGRLLAICQKVKLSVWLAEGSRELWERPANPDRCAAFSADGKWIATGDQDGTVSLWEVASAGRLHRTLSGHTASVTGVSFHPDGSRLVSSSFDGQVKVWDLNSGAELLTIPVPGGNNLWHAVFSPDGKMIAAAGGDGVVTLWKTQ
jgi:WD40 repeat protein/tRNA A-37 threonylcarbamoyl transferase component Bud32